MKFDVLLLLAVVVTAVVGQTTKPIEVLAILPGINYVEGESVQLQNRDAITVIFSGAVIPLGGDWGALIPQDYVPMSFDGANVPGKMRWVTTSIARFDPDIDWPNDLEFTLVVRSMTNFQGRRVTGGSVRYYTAPTTLSISSVDSPATKALTDNLWDPTVAKLRYDGELISGYEVPPDGLIYVSFSHDVDLDLVSPSLVVRDTSTNNPVTFRAERCHNSTVVMSSCLAIRMSEELTVGATYSLTLPGGSRTSQYGGITKTSTATSFNGLYEFKLPFLTNLFSVQYRHLNLYLRHGLLDFDVEEWRSTISISPELLGGFTISRPTLATLQISGAFEPDTAYTITVQENRNIRDGYHLYLLGSSITFQTVPSTSFAIEGVSPSSASVYFESFTGSWAVLSRTATPCTHPRTISFTNVNTNNFPSVWASMKNYQSTFITLEDYSVPSRSTLEVTDIPLESYFGSTGLLYKESELGCDYNSKSTLLISRSKIGVTVLGGPSLLVWATNTETNQPVSGATVRIYRISSNAWWSPSPQDIQIYSTGTTDANGVYQASVSEYLGTVVALVESEGNLVVSPEFFANSPRTDTTNYVAEVITDRGFYKPKDPMYLKGYVRLQNTDKTISFPPPSSFSLSITWKDNEAPRDYPVVLNEFGSFDLKVVVPEDTKYGANTIQLSAGFQTIKYTPFIISEPRIPTTKLEFSSTETIYRPENQFPIKVHLSTYTGESIQDAPIKISWLLKRQRPWYWLAGYYFGSDVFRSGQPTLPDEKGEFEVVTDANGDYSGSFSLVLNNPALEGNTLEITAEYFSLTKELLSEKLSFQTAYSELSLSLKPTFEGSILPGQMFGVFSSVHHISSRQIPNLPIAIDFFTWDGVTPDIDRSTGKIKFGGVLLKTCDATSKALGDAFCEFQLPAIGQYLVVATVEDDKGYKVTSFLVVGQTEEEWRKHPLDSWNAISVYLDSDRYTLPSVATVSFFSPFQEVLVLTRWGNVPNQKVQISTHASGFISYGVQLGNECFGSCSLDVVITSGRSTTALPSVPISVLFDPNAPTFVWKSLSITIDNPVQNLNVTVELEKKTVLPGEDVTVDITLEKDGVPISGEIAVFVVDKAVLDLLDHPVAKFNESLSSYTLADYYNVHDTRSEMATEVAYLKAKEILERRLRADPWVSEQWPLFNLYHNPLSLDVSDEEFFNRYIYQITAFPVSYVPFYFGYMTDMMEASDGMRMESNTALAGDMRSEKLAEREVALPSVAPTAAPTPAPTAAIAVRSDFKSTPFFLGSKTVDETGKTRVVFKSPDNIGKFEIRVYAIDKSSNFGVGTTEQISSKLISLQSSAPRIVRYGDRFQAGVTITIHNSDFDGELAVDVSHVCSILSLEGSSNKTVHLQGTGPHLVNFQFSAIGTGDAYLLFKVSRGAVIEDAAIYSQDIRGQQEPVFIATSMAVSKLEPDTEGFKVPPSVAYSGSLSIDAGVGRLPAVTFYANYILSVLRYPDPSADTLLASLSAHLSYLEYGITTLQPIFDQSLQRLRSYTLSSYGLQQTSYHYYPYIDVRLQAYGLFILNKINAKLPYLSSVTNDLSTQWTDAMWSSLVQQVQLSRRYNSRYSDFETLAFVYLGIDNINDVSNYVSPTDLQDLSLDYLLENTRQLSSGGKSALALGLINKNIHIDVAEQLLDQLTNTFRTQGRTAYITEASSQNPAFLACSIGLNAFTQSGRTFPLFEKLANFVGLVDSSYSWYRLYGESLSHSLFGLTAYDKSRGNTSPNLHLAVVSGNKELLTADFDSPSDAAASSTFYFEDIQDPNNISFTACCVGEASIVFGATFIPLEISREPIYRGIAVEKVIQLVDSIGNTVGGPIEEVPIGKKVKVTIQITIPDYSSSIIIVDPFTGAIEPFDDLIYDQGSSSVVDSSPFRLDYWSWYLWGGFSQKEFKKDKVIFYGKNLFAGSHSVSYLALVNTEGQFVNPPALAYDEHQPELMGLSAGGNFTTKTLPDLLPELFAVSDCLPWKDRALSWDDMPGYVVRPTDPDSNIEPPPNNPLPYANSDKSMLPSWAVVSIVLGIIVVVGSVSAIVYYVRTTAAKKYAIVPA